MKPKYVRLFALAWPLALLPLMNFEFDEIPAWFTTVEGRGVVSQLLSQILQGFADVLIQLIIYPLFGAAIPA